MSRSPSPLSNGRCRISLLSWGVLFLIALSLTDPAESRTARKLLQGSIGKSLTQLRKDIPALKSATKVNYTQEAHVPFVSCDIGKEEAAVSLAVYGPFNNVRGIQAISIVSGSDNLTRVAQSLAAVIAASTGEKDKQRVMKWASSAIRSTTSKTHAPPRMGDEIGWGTGESVVAEESRVVFRGIRVKLNHSFEHAGDRRHLIVVVIGSEVH